MPAIWDYDINELKKSAQGRRLILERKINLGVDYRSNDPDEKISLKEVKDNWDKLQLDPKKRRLFEVLLEDKYGKNNFHSTPNTNF